MIWNTDPIEQDGGGLFDQLVMHIESVCPEDGEWEERAEHVARAVECYVEHACTGGCADARSLVLMATQALQSVGEGKVARRFLLHGTGLVRPSEWEVTGGDTLWVLDLRQISAMDDAPLELIFFTGLGIIIDSLAEVWDRTSGQGTLGLRHVFQAAESLLGTECPQQEARGLCDEIRTRCEHRLAKQQQARGWSASPVVMNLDL